MKKTIFKRVFLLAMAFLMAFSIIPVDAIDDSLFAFASNSEKTLKATAPSWLENAVFDAMVYRDRYGLTNMTDAELKNHWTNIGIPEGRSASVFLDIKYYVEQNDDLKKEFGTDYRRAYDHFMTNGYKEKRPSSLLFNGSYYCEKNADVAADYKDEYLRHYIETGVIEGRRASRTFDADYYWFIRPDVEAVWPGNYKMCARHYAGHGIKAGIVAHDVSFPVISEIAFSNVSTEGYTVVCKVTDDWGVNKVAFPSWTTANGDDDIPANYMNTQKGTKNGSYFTFRVKTSDHNNAVGEYTTKIYAVDLGGNTVDVDAGTVVVKGTPSDSFVLYSFSQYSLSDKFVKNVSHSTTVNSFINQFDNDELKVLNSSNVQITGKTIVGTGAVINLCNGDEIKDSLTVVIEGDVNGDGCIDSTDCMRLKASLLDLIEFTECQFAAADSDESGSLNATDYIRIKYKLLNISSDSEDDGEAKKPSLEFSDVLYVTENGNRAHVLAAGGVVYDASGYSSYSNSRFTVNSGLKISLNNFTTAFNRITLCYVASNPMKCTVTYTVGGKTVNDLFYLEAGTQTFCGLIKGYLDGKKATKLSSITLSTCEGVNGTFALCNVKTEDYALYADDVYYIEDGYYKLGIRLTWGGGISYLYDKTATSEGLTNLINQYDTGRLVQQSYYGTNGTKDDYVMGYFNNSDWPYNPVQGGDKANNPSRIVDVVVSKTSIYIKAQPMDWGHNGSITPSYMENVYTLEDHLVRVDNRFVDFSGWTHRYVDQELPAFYTVSYLDNFTYYGGSKSWTDDTLTSRNDLPFWGGEYHNDCLFYMRESNTETWCAWTNSNSGYGIGLYVPNIDVFLAGRSNGTTITKDPYAAPTCYVAPLNQMLMVSYEPIEYSYLMTTGALENIRKAFKNNKDFATNDSLHKNYKSCRIPD